MAEKKKVVVDLIVDSKKAEKGVDNVGKAADKSTKSVGGLTKGLKGIGVAFKALGIGLIIGAIAGLTEAFSRNEKITNGLSIVMTTIGNVFSQVTDAIVATYESVTSASENFNGLGKVIGGLLTIAITPLKLSFYAIKLALQTAQLAWEESFFGDKDPTTIKDLNARIAETKQNMEDVGVAAVNAGKDVVNNFGDAVGEIANIGAVAISKLSEVSVKTAYEEAKAYKEAENNAIEAAARQSLLVERYDRQAEQLRQIRDEERNSISERKKANDELLIVLDEQEKSMLKQADLQIQAAKLERDRNNNAETRAALIDALANKEGVLAQVEGFRSEQKANDLALDKEQIELTNSKLDSEAALAFERKKFNAEKIDDERMRLEALAEIYEEEATLERDRLQEQIDVLAEGTQAKIDAQIALDEFNNENAEKQYEIKKGLSDLEVKEDERIQASKLKGLDLITRIFGEESKLGKAALLAKQAIALQELLIDLGAIKSTATRATAEASIEGAKSGANSASGLAATLKAGLPQALPALIAYATTAAGVISGVKSAIGGVKKVAGKYGGGGGGGANISTPQASVAQSPSFNVVGGSETSQLAQTVAAANDKPTQTYVVSSEVQNANELERKRVSSAGF